MATSNLNFNPNARFNSGANTAAGGRASTSVAMQAADPTGTLASGVLNNTTVITGFNAAGVSKNNPGPNVAGAPRSVNGN
jgi:hypothetical protein